MTDDPESSYDHPPNRRGAAMTKHEVRIEAEGARDAVVNVACQGEGCPLCASTAEGRARIAFVKKELA